MTVHLLKLCVGAECVDDLLDWQRERFGGGPAVHVTRMWPKREAEIRDGGSLFWVFRGLVLARQRVLGLERRVGADGVGRCAILLDCDAVRVRPIPRRPFQGWRYLEPADAPPDLDPGRPDEPELPPALVAELAAMGVG
jgi:hypothetical protein